MQEKCTIAKWRLQTGYLEPPALAVHYPRIRTALTALA